jgi:GTP-binding protein LepA
MLPGYKEVRPMVFCGLYPIDSSDYEKLKAALGRLRLNDSAFVYSQESSVALGFGFRCGFLGLLHMEIIQERIRREHDVEIISTYPSVIYKVVKHGGAKRSRWTTRSTCPTRHDRGDHGADAQGVDPHPQRLDGRHAGARDGEARRGRAHRHARRHARDAELHLPLNEILVDFNDR